MVSNIVAFDNEDKRLGSFFALCGAKVSQAIRSIGKGAWECIEMNTGNLNEVHLQLRAEQMKGNYVFTSYTHGSTTGLFSGNSAFIQAPLTVNHLSNTFSYCFACYSGQDLAIDLINHGTLCFIGYSKAASIVTSYKELFAECVISGLLAFYKGTTTSECYSLKRKKYQDEIDNLYKKNYFVSSVLMDNRDCLVLHGNGELTISDFEE